jgi:hypothetical protein
MASCGPSRGPVRRTVITEARRICQGVNREGLVRVTHTPGRPIVVSSAATPGETVVGYRAYVDGQDHHWMLAHTGGLYTPVGGMVHTVTVQELTAIINAVSPSYTVCMRRIPGRCA